MRPLLLGLKASAGAQNVCRMFLGVSGDNRTNEPETGTAPKSLSSRRLPSRPGGPPFRDATGWRVKPPWLRQGPRCSIPAGLSGGCSSWPGPNQTQWLWLALAGACPWCRNPSWPGSVPSAPALELVVAVQHSEYGRSWFGAVLTPPQVPVVFHERSPPSLGKTAGIQAHRARNPRPRCTPYSTWQFARFGERSCSGVSRLDLSGDA